VSWRRTGPGGNHQDLYANHLLSRANDMLQSALVFGSGSSVPDGDGGGEDGLDDGSVELHQHCLWQDDRMAGTSSAAARSASSAGLSDVQLPLEVLGDGGAHTG